MLGMHGTYEANMSMHDCDVMICIGARFDDRITGRLDAFSPGSKKIHVDIDPSSINKNVKVDVPIIGDCAHVLEDMVRLWRSTPMHPATAALAPCPTQPANSPPPQPPPPPNPHPPPHPPHAPA